MQLSILAKLTYEFEKIGHMPTHALGPLSLSLRTRGMHAISLFSGVGGIDLGLKSFCRTVLYCEVDPGCRRVLQTRMAGGQLPQAPLHADVTTLTKEALHEHLGDVPVDIIFGGFPCEPAL